ncbi:MAG: carbohydrate kinase [Cyclobacteriaceae bacterium]|nr:carbohydrate kinase [Cyclobacteriaceae bacterium]
MSIPVIAIFDIGKTNKKLFLFDEEYTIVFEKSAHLPETIDEDGDPCEDIDVLQKWIMDSFHETNSLAAFRIEAINFSTYGASFVHLGKDHKPITPLYNYLKSFPEDLKTKFYSTYGGEKAFAQATASPVLGLLNSGMQLYWLKYKKPDVFEKIKVSLHLPQFISSLFTGIHYTDITSIGCHTNLWNFQDNHYHQWVREEEVDRKLAPIKPSDSVIPSKINQQPIVSGIGLHDSSAALIPYLSCFPEPFILLSTGTWCISLNPFNNMPLTDKELSHDCLCYFTYKGNAVKASRLFTGLEHEQQVKKLADHFHQNETYYSNIGYNPEIVKEMKNISFQEDKLAEYQSYEVAYTLFIKDLVKRQVTSTNRVLNNTPVKRIFVDGGFSKNQIFMHLLSEAMPSLEVYAASIAQATALGAAMAIHHHWNNKPLRNTIIDLQYFPTSSGAALI